MADQQLNLKIRGRDRKTAFDIEELVDELCVKLKEAEKEGDECLKEKTNSENLFNNDLQPSNSDLASRYYSAFPALSKGSPLENSFPLTSVWSRNICRVLGSGSKRGDSESSIKDKVSKRKENKENVLCGDVNIGGVRRMRSRSTVKQSSGHHYRNRAKSAKSLDRKVDEFSTAMKRSYGATKTMSCADVDGAAGNQDSGNEMGDPRGKKSLNFMDNSFGSFISTIGQPFFTAPDHHLISAPESYDSAELPVDFKKLLTSPIGSKKDFKLPHSLRSGCSSGAPSGNFIQCGTNITSSIWSDTCEKMEEDESSGNSGKWETKCSRGMNNAGTGGGCSKWSDARSSILSSAWKLPFVYDKDIERTSLAVNANSGSFYSFFDTNPNSTSFLTSNENKTFKVDDEKPEDNKGTFGSVGDKEEDLLTSMKTHFRPIKNNENGNQNGGTVEEGTSLEGANKPREVIYKDGSTFTDRVSSPVKLDYGRSESGAFFLAATGEKYFEFKRTSPHYLLHPNPQQPQDEFSSKDTSETFIPKFKIQQNEKFCQTDSPLTEMGSSAFFFPGDDRFAKEIVNDSCDDHDDEVEVDTEDNDECSDGKRNDEDSRPMIQVSGWVTAWPITMDSNAAIWASVPNSNNTKPWMFGKNDDLDGPSQHDCRMDDRNEHYLRLKDELSEEGEELLSDLSSIHLFLDPERMEDPHPHLKNALTLESARL